MDEKEHEVNSDPFSRLMFGEREQQPEEKKPLDMTQLNVSNYNYTELFEKVDSIMESVNKLKPLVNELSPLLDFLKKKKD
ncbi:hypothetical protein [Bacillus alkalisoli]|uniref:hypothetical protein n=1 Tax=Bacillus alkalisoli TaxID=2011008 RepID=UPI000C243F3F|nr:hypothetical protein [Bacillus alkalisoli]